MSLHNPPPPRADQLDRPHIPPRPIDLSLSSPVQLVQFCSLAHCPTLSHLVAQIRSVLHLQLNDLLVPQLRTTNHLLNSQRKDLLVLLQVENLLYLHLRSNDQAHLRQGSSVRDGFLRPVS